MNSRPKEPSSVFAAMSARLLFFAGLTCFLLSPAALAQTTSGARKDSSTSTDSSKGAVERGKYIVEGVARCTQCHTPHDAQGVPDRYRWLDGGALWLQPAWPMQDWPLQVPRIAGNPPGTDEEMVRLLTTGIWKDGSRLREPMPQFRMTTADAAAVVAYLKSLTPLH